MSLLIGYEMEIGRFGLCCSECSALIGAITIEEAQHLMINNVEPLCFDCDPLEVDAPPKHLISQEDSYFLGIENKVFLAEWLTDTVFPDAKDLRLTQISLLTYYDIKTGFSPKYQKQRISQNGIH